MNSLVTLLSPSSKTENIPKNSSIKDTASEEKSGNLDFISILFSQIEESSKISSKQDVKIATSSDKLEKSIKNSDKQKSSDELLLSDILNIINLLKNGDKGNNFPKFSDKMDKILSNESIKNDFKNVKNLDDLLKLSKKYDLGLKEIEFTKQSIDNLKKDFPKLDIENFFNRNNNKKTDSPINKIDTKIENKSKYFTNSLEAKSVKTKSKDENENTLQDILKRLNSKELSTKQNQPIIHNDKKSSSQKVEKDLTPKGKSSEVRVIKEDIKEKIIDTKNSDKLAENKESKKRTITTEITQEKHSTKQNIQDDILHKIKSQKHSNISNFEKIKSMASENLSKDDSSVEIKKSQDSIPNHKREFQTSSHIDYSKTDKQVKVDNSLNRFTNDLKEKIDAYKPPLMKVKMALNPKNLGEVEVTLIHRGNNLHVNITSNTNTMSLFTQNQAEFKNSLVNMGFTNLEMNFSDQGKNSRQNQQSSKKNGLSFEEYNSQDEQESSVELIVPRYI